MAVVLPLLCFVLLVRAWPRHHGLRARLLGAATAWGVAVLIVTEAASAAGMLTRGVLIVAWGLAATLAGFAPAVPRHAEPTAPPAEPTDWASPSTLVMAAAIVGIASTTGLLAAVAWPSQWDSMVYHLPRIDHWIQNRSVAFYPTHIVRQLFNPPWSEYAMLHLLSTGGDERWANAVQWLSMVGSLVGVSLIADRLGAGPRGQLFAALFCATVPMGILQASGTQNDYVTAFWLVCTVAALLATVPRVTTGLGAASVGTAFGLAVLTKGTAGVLGLPLLIALWPWRARPRAAVVRSGAVAAMIALALNAAHLHRNLDGFRSPPGQRPPGPATRDVVGDLLNPSLSPASFASNLVRNVSLHVGTRFGSLNAVLQSGIERAHAAFGLDVNDPRTTRLYPLASFAVDGRPNDPDRTGNPVHLAILFVSAVLAPGWPRRGRVGIGRYGLALVLSFAAFCLVFKWQPWHSRLHLPLFVLAAPLAGAVLERYPRVTVLAALVATVTAAPPLLTNVLAPLDRRQNALTTPRIQQYFHRFGGPVDNRERGYTGAAAFLRARGCAHVGLLLGWDDWEHPLWILLADGVPGGARIRHVAVKNASAAHLGTERPSAPCGIFVGSVAVDEPFELAGRSYRLAWSGAGFKVLMSEGASAAATAR
jgi:4-amino-4-deoxy-L-arabinose transferase-like glycosyltransferase